MLLVYCITFFDVCKCWSLFWVWVGANIWNFFKDIVAGEELPEKGFQGMVMNLKCLMKFVFLESSNFHLVCGGCSFLLTIGRRSSKKGTVWSLFNAPKFGL